MVLVPPTRFGRWLENFERSHGPTSYAVRDGGLVGEAEDGSTFRAEVPFGRAYDGETTRFAEDCTPPASWGVLLVRKGGFAVARLEHDRVVDSKVGQRHVQGRTKAGGQSQQRFARRRDNQARAAYDAAAEHAARVLAGAGVVVTGGDRAAVDAALGDRRLARLTVVAPFLSTPDPRRSVLDQAVVDAASIRIDVRNAPARP